MNADAYKFHRLPNTPANRFKGYPIISDQVGAQELEVIWIELKKVLDRGTSGSIVEFGCYAGTTSLFIRRLLDQTGESATRPFHVYDSFQGLPAKTTLDESPAGVDFAAGKLSVGKKEFLGQFRAAGLAPPSVHKGWFAELTAGDVPNEIAFAYLDGDFYESILSSLALVWPRLSPGAVVVVDDYNREALPGPARAINAYFAGRPRPHIAHMHDMAIMQR